MQRSLVVAILFLAGCGTPPSEEDQLRELVSASEVDVEPTDTTGAIRGIVVDAAINPIAGATASILEREVRTDAVGTFGFTLLEPGVYFVQVRMPGFLSSEQPVTVVAGKEADWTKFVLEGTPPEEPRYDAYRYEGFLNVGIGFSILEGVGFPFTWGGGGVTGNSSRAEYGVAEPYRLIQTELAWQPSVPMNRLAARHAAFPAGSNTGCGFGSEGGLSPVVLRTSGSPGFCAVDPPMRLVVEAAGGYDPTLPASVGWAVLQEFEMHTHIFYNFEPPEGWTFSQDGPPGS